MGGGNREVSHTHWRHSRNPEQPRSQRGGDTVGVFDVLARLRGLPQKSLVTVLCCQEPVWFYYTIVVFFAAAGDFFFFANFVKKISPRSLVFLLAGAA